MRGGYTHRTDQHGQRQDRLQLIFHGIVSFVLRFHYALMDVGYDLAGGLNGPCLPSRDVADVLPAK